MLTLINEFRAKESTFTTFILENSCQQKSLTLNFKMENEKAASSKKPHIFLN